MKIKPKAILMLAVLVSVVVVSGCAQQPADGGPAATGTPKATTTAAPEIKTQEEAAKTVVDTSKEVKKISDTLADIDKTLGGKK